MQLLNPSDREYYKAHKIQAYRTLPIGEWLRTETMYFGPISRRCALLHSDF
jgi:hypothetical protein